MCKQKFFLIIFSFFIAAVTLFPSCKKDNNNNNPPANDKSALNTLIDSVNTILNTTVEGNKPGQYSTGSKAALDSTLQLAESVSANDTYTQQEVNNATANLQRAVTVFNSHLIREVSVANLIAFWKFNGNANDSSGNGHNGALKTGWTGPGNAPVDGGTLPILIADRFGRANMAYDFNNGATVEVPYDAALNPQSFTISLWLKRHGTNCNNYFFSLNRWNGYKFQLQCNNFLFLTFHGDNGYHDVDSNPADVPDETWTHVAASYTNGTMKFYVNGELKRSVAVTGVPLTLSEPVNLAIGNELPKDEYTINSSDDYTYYGGDYFIGSLDDVRFYNVALTDAEVLSIYTIEESL
ncbi:MAG TPA: LamG-like jellyroll fold domain-containing protein [Parafilimonas sp.]|nr:LamG-like jellyroll fold domain-containing protein [Parafilimonas sp.]